jgi:hypothetical protein
MIKRASPCAVGFLFSEEKEDVAPETEIWVNSSE